MNKFFIVLLAVLCYSSNLFAQQQDVPFSKKYFPTRKEKLKAALKHIKLGDELQEVHEDYDGAVEYYLKANAFNSNNAELNYKIGRSLLRAKKHDRKECLKYFKKCYKLSEEEGDHIHYYIGRGLHLNGDFQGAIIEYKLAKVELKENEAIKKRIHECENALKLASTKNKRIFIDNLGKDVNSKYHEYGVVVSADESIMFFTSRRPDTFGGEKDDHDHLYYEDIYKSEYDPKTHKWSKAVNMKRVNSIHHDATVGLSPDGTRMLMFVEGDIYECDLIGNHWTAPKKFPKTINTKYNETSACFSFDSRRLYFVSNNPKKSHGQKDIFYSDLNEKGEWGEAVNIGLTINTEHNEEGVFLHPDGKTMYFSSEGHESIGGFDIFKSTLQENGTWSEPVNIGFPVNSPDDDIFFVMNAKGNRGYYASYQSDTNGGRDIYKITFLGPEKPLIMNTEDVLLASTNEPIQEVLTEPVAEVNSNNLTVFKGTVVDAETGSAVAANIEIIDLHHQNEKREAESNSSTGKFLLPLPAGKDYAIAIEAEGYLFHSENFNIPNGNGFLEINKKIELFKLAVGSKVVLKNIFFDSGKATLKPESEAELGIVIKLMKMNPNVKMEMGGHTDSIGSDATNLKLSQARAKSVVDYLIGHGIPAKRLVAKGYGEKEPVADNKTDEGRQQNRRTEMKIIE